MIDKEVIYNSEYLVIVPSTLRHLAKAFEYTYGNVLVFDDLEKRYSARNGGYTRILKLAERRGDDALMVILELVEGE